MSLLSGLMNSSEKIKSYDLRPFQNKNSHFFKKSNEACAFFFLFFWKSHFWALKMEKFIPGSRELVQMIVDLLHIHDIIRYSQKKMTENILLCTLFQNTHVGISTLFAFLKTKKKGDAPRFLDARGDVKQVINLERPKDD